MLLSLNLATHRFVWGRIFLIQLSYLLTDTAIALSIANLPWCCLLSFTSKIRLSSQASYPTLMATFSGYLLTSLQLVWFSRWYWQHYWGFWKFRRSRKLYCWACSLHHIGAGQFHRYHEGVGRIAEVAARFTLDAMPGKQMSIDAF